MRIEQYLDADVRHYYFVSAVDSLFFAVETRFFAFSNCSSAAASSAMQVSISDPFNHASILGIWARFPPIIPGSDPANIERRCLHAVPLVPAAQVQNAPSLFSSYIKLTV